MDNFSSWLLKPVIIENKSLPIWWGFLFKNY